MIQYKHLAHATDTLHTYKKCEETGAITQRRDMAAAGATTRQGGKH
jgi:hypothetical protein